MLALICILVAVGGLILEAFAMERLWSWFIAPGITSVPDIVYGAALGLIIVIIYFLTGPIPQDEKHAVVVAASIIGVMSSIFFLSVGGIVHLILQQYG